MHGKEFLVDMITTYFTVVTFITAATYILGVCLIPDARFGYDAFAAPLIYGACGVLPNMVMYSKRELTVKEILIRKVIQLVLIEVIILTVAFGDIGIQGENHNYAVAMGISIFVIYVLTHVVSWFQNYASAKRMTEDLIKFQESVKE